LIVQSNYELNKTLRAQEISKITQDILEQAPVIWLGQDLALPATGNGVGPTIFNKCVSGDPGMFQNPAYWVFVGLNYNTMFYTC
jgi:hypothetical protein